MTYEPARRRVAVYVIRGREPHRELLVFDHVDVPESGTQIPAGGIRDGESVEAAAAREVSEETGLDRVAISHVVGSSGRPHPDSGAGRHTTYLLATTDSVTDTWENRVTGSGEDQGLRFRCWFEPLPLDGILLADHQDEFLRQASDDLTSDR